MPLSGANSGHLNTRIINSNDSLIFDLANATLTATYIDIPIYALSDDVIQSLDYSIQFNLTKLTYSMTVDLLPSDPTILSASFFNPTTLKLKYTGSTLQSYPAGPGVIYITKIRFMLAAPCIPITAADFNNVVVFLNGGVCASRFTTPNFQQYVPLADFTWGPSCSNAAIQFTNASTVSNGTINASSWTFGNGTSTLTSPAHNYTATGTAAATLVVTTSIGCKDTIVHTFTVSAPPSPAFTFSFDCIKDSVFFVNTSSVSVGQLAGSQWNFGDQVGSSTATNPVYHYNTSGFFTVGLTAISDVTCAATATLVLDLSNKVVASFSITSPNKCVGTVISFTDASSYALANINSWAWAFGDGAVASGTATAHSFNVSGTFSITLVSTAEDGCNGKVQQLIAIDPLPVVQFAAISSTGCAQAPVSFTNQSVTAPGSTWNWNFGDALTSTQQHPQHTYAAPGQYSIKLVVLTPAGCSDSLSRDNYLEIYPAPNAGFTLSEYCIAVNIFFKNTTSISSGSLSAWLWNFGDGTSSNDQNPVHSYSLSGTYIATLTATSALGCSTTVNRTLLLTNRPVVSFVQVSGLDCSGETLSFTNLSSAAGGASSLWRFGDGTSSGQSSPVHTYMNSGFYAIKLIVTNPGGCTDSLTKPYTVSIPPPVVAQFSQTVVSNSVVLFTNLSENSTKLRWDFGDNTSSLSNRPQHTFPDIGDYRVCLTAYNSLNCSDTVCSDVYTGISRIVAIPSAFTPNDDNNNDVLRVRGGPFAEMSFMVFNNWGNLVFSSADQAEGWDGTYRGEAQPIGVYEYVLKAKTLDDKKINLYGVVNLTR